MPKDLIYNFVGNIHKEPQNKFRKSLQTLQLSADELELSGKSMLRPDDQVETKRALSKVHEKVTADGKENSVAPRRSKRAAANLVNYAESPDDPKKANPNKSVPVKTKPKKTVDKTKKGKASTVKKTKSKIDSNQSTLNFSSVPAAPKEKSDILESVPPPKEESCISPSLFMTEDSGFDPSNGVSSPEPTLFSAVSNAEAEQKCTVTPDKEMCILTCANPPLSYWKDLAEERRIALEKALHENELLHDQVIVLEAENSQLKQLVKEAENLAQIIKSIVQ